MALLTLAELKTRTGITGTDATRDASLTQLILDVDAAVKRLTGQNIEQATYTDKILDAPYNTKFLQLPQWPVSSITSLYLNGNAKGDPSLFDSTHLLTNYTDYKLRIDDFVNGRSKRGAVEILSRSYWAYWQQRTLSMPLTNSLTDAPGAIKCTWVAGYATVPDDLKGAVAAAVMLLYDRRQTGSPLTSESWNGRSVGYDGAFTATAAVHSPDVWQVVRHYANTLSLA
jgi:hypothetical protein